MLVTLISLRGMISNIAIENPEHNSAIEKMDRLMSKLGPLARMDTKEIIPLIKKLDNIITFYFPNFIFAH